MLPWGLYVIITVTCLVSINKIPKIFLQYTNEVKNVGCIWTNFLRQRFSSHVREQHRSIYVKEYNNFYLQVMFASVY